MYRRSYRMQVPVALYTYLQINYTNIHTSYSIHHIIYTKRLPLV